MTKPLDHRQIRVSVTPGLAAAIDWQTRCARAEGQRDAARDLVCDIAGYAQNPQIPMPADLHRRLCAAVRQYTSSEARGDAAPSPTAGSGGGLDTGSSTPRGGSSAHHAPASDDDGRVIVVLTRAEAAVMAGQLDAIARMLGEELVQSFDATAAAHGPHSAGAAFHPPVRSGAIDDADTSTPGDLDEIIDVADTPLTPGELDEIEDTAVARHMEGAAVDVTPRDVLRLVEMARGHK